MCTPWDEDQSEHRQPAAVSSGLGIIPCDDLIRFGHTWSGSPQHWGSIRPTIDRDAINPMALRRERDERVRDDRWGPWCIRRHWRSVLLFFFGGGGLTLPT